MKKQIFFLTLMLVGSLMFITGMLWGATTGTIVGTVADPSGAVIAGAKLQAVNPNTGFKRETVSNNEGFYRLDLLPVGIYNVSAETTGFKKVLHENIALSVNDFLTVDFKLEVGQLSETVTVEEKPSEVNTESSTLGRTVDNRTLTDLPVLSGAAGRNPLQLAPLQAGVAPAGQVGPFSVNGQRAQSNNFLLDGGDSNDLAINVPDAVGGFSPDAMQEFRILTNTYSAEFGRNSGSIVNVISKSGANQFHGNVFEFFRNRKLNATPFFNNSSPVFNGLRNPQFNVNEFGGTLGGPIRKDKTFFFFSYEGFRRRQGVTSSATVPNDAQRALINQFGTEISKKLLAQVPAASTGNTLFSSVGNKLDRNQYFARVDHNISDKNRFFGTFFTEKQTFTDPFAFGGSAIPGFGTDGTLRFVNVVLSDTHVLNERMVNEVRFSYHRRGTLSVLNSNKTKISSFGINGVISDDADAEGPPRVDISGFSNFGNTIQGPQGRADNTFQYTDNFSHRVRNSHFMKYGGDVRTFAQNQVFDFINNGFYSFQGGVGAAFGKPSIPGLSAALSDFANGTPIFYVQNSAGRRGYRTRSANFYWLDDYKVKPHLTLNLGLRYEFNSNLFDIRDRVLAFRPGQQSTVFPTAPRGIVYPGDANISQSTYPNDYNNFSPRFGFAWDVLKNGKLSVRGGYGLFYDIVISETTLQFLTAPPFAIQPFILFTTLNNPFSNSLVNPIPQPFPFKPVKPGEPFNFVDIAPIGLTVNEANFRTPYSHQFNLGIQYEFRKGYTLEVGYVGTIGVKLLSRREINPAIVTPNANSANTDSRRVFNQNNPDSAKFGDVFSGITNQETSANSNYNSLQITVSKRFSHGFQFQNSYTYSHTIDNASGLRSNVRFNNPRADRSDSEQDIRQRYVVSYLWDLPWGKRFTGAMGKLFDGWEIAGVTTFQTGLPFNIVEPTDRSLTAAGSDRPDFIGGTVQFFDPRNTNPANGGANFYFNGTGGGTATAATNPNFRRVGSGLSVAQGAGRFGNLGRNVFHGPGINNFDFSILKRTKVRENQNFEFRAEFFNVWNHAQFGNPNGNIGSPNFGKITTAANPRLIQFAVKYNF